MKIELGKPVSFHPHLAKALGGIKEALFIQQIYFWSDKGKRQDGFIYKTTEDIEEETTIKKRTQYTLRQKLEKMGVLETKLIKANGVPTLHYKVAEPMLQKLLDGCGNNCRTHSAKVAEPITESTTESTQRLNTPQTKVCEKFILSDYLNSFDTFDRVAMIIRWYFRKKGLDFPTKKAVQKEYARWIRDAKVLADYPNEKIIETQERVEAKFPLDWKLSTIVKYISETPTNQEILERFKKQAIAEVGLDRDWEARVRDKLNELWGLEYSTCRQDPRMKALIEKNPWLK